MNILITNKKLNWSNSSIVSSNNAREVIKSLSSKKELALVIYTKEFEHINPTLNVVGFFDEKDSYIFDMNFISINDIKTIFEQNILFVAHNMKYCLSVLYYYGIKPSKTYDCMLSEAILTQGMSFDKSERSLKALLKKHCEIEFSDAYLGCLDEDISEKAIECCFNQVSGLLSIRDSQMLEIEKDALNPSLKIDNEFCKTLAYSEHCGIGFSMDKWKASLNLMKISLHSIRAEITEFIISNKLNEFLSTQLDMFDSDIDPCRLKLTTVSDVKKALELIKPKVSAYAFNRLEEISERFYDEYKEWKKPEDRIHKLINPTTKRLHPGYRQIGTASKTSFLVKKNNKVAYLNFNSVRNEFMHRIPFIAEEGNSIIYAEYPSQIMGVYANLSKSDALCDLIRNKIDIYSYIAKNLYSKLIDVNIEDIAKEFPEERGFAERVSQACLYGKDPRSIMFTEKITEKQAKQCFNRIKKILAGSESFIDDCKRQVGNGGVMKYNGVSNRMEYVKYYDAFHTLSAKLNGNFWEYYKKLKGVKSELFETEYRPKAVEYFMLRSKLEINSVSHVIEGTCSDINKMAGILITKEIFNRGLFDEVKIINVSENGFSLECPKVLTEQVKDFVHKSMTNASKTICRKVELYPEITENFFWFK